MRASGGRAKTKCPGKKDGRQSHLQEQKDALKAQIEREETAYGHDVDPDDIMDM